MNGWRIGRIGGIPIEINSSWLLIFALFFYDLGSDVFPRLADGGVRWAPWVAALCATLLFFASVLLHELAHSFVARRAGIEVNRITLFIFGGVAQVEEEPRRATDELLIALAGPGTSLLLSLGFGGLYWVLGRLDGLPWLPATSTGVALTAACLQYVAIANLALAIFNMVPGFPMDGGRVLRSLLWYYWGDLLRATRVASIMGQGVGYALIGLGVYTGLRTGSLLAGAWHVLLGMLLQTVARQAYHRELARATFARATVGQLAMPPGAVFQVGTPLSIAAHYCQSRPHDCWAPVLQAAQPVGLLSLARVLQVPAWEWSTVPVERVMEPLREELVVRHSAPALEVARRLAETGHGELLVLDDWGNLLGVITESALASVMPTRSQ